MVDQLVAHLTRAPLGRLLAVEGQVLTARGPDLRERAPAVEHAQALAYKSPTGGEQVRE